MNHNEILTAGVSKVTRRDALARALKSSFAAVVAGPALTQAAPAPEASEPEFVPENDYPFFGGELPPQ